MHLRNYSIGARLLAGFGAVLAILVFVVLAANVLNAKNKESLIRSLEGPREKSTLAASMKTALLEAGVSMRNIALQSEVSDMQREAELVKSHNKRYLESRQRFLAIGATSAEKQILEQVEALKAQLEGPLQEALSNALTFNADGATETIAKTVDPLNKKTVLEIDKLVVLQQAAFNDALAASVQADRRLMYLLIAVGAVALFLGGTFAWVIRRSIVVPLRNAVKLACLVAEGDLSSAIDHEGKDEVSMLLASLSRMNSRLADIVAEVRQGTETITIASQEIAAGNSDLSSRTEVQAESLRETSESLRDLTEAVRQNADNSKQANLLVKASAEVASKGGEAINDVVQTMQRIRGSSRKVVEIIGVIDGIAFQTNILALNAAVEAARAGEQGRGFAVVAAEVRALAQRSAAAAKEITELISSSVHEVEAGSELVDSSGKTMSDIVLSVNRIATLIGEIAVATDEQSLSIEQLNERVSLMDEATQRNAALVEQAAAAAESMRDQADSLNNAVSVFKLAPAPEPFLLIEAPAPN